MFSLYNEKRTGLLVAIDFEKAFDSVAFSFIQRVLNLFNFGPSIIQWVNTFYNAISSSVLVNGFLSDSFPVERGCKQGDPLSPCLFNLVVQVLNTLIYMNPLIRGIDIRGRE